MSDLPYEVQRYSPDEMVTMFTTAWQQDLTEVDGERTYTVNALYVNLQTDYPWQVVASYSTEGYYRAQEATDVAIADTNGIIPGLPEVGYE